MNKSIIKSVKFISLLFLILNLNAMDNKQTKKSDHSKLRLVNKELIYERLKKGILARPQSINLETGEIFTTLSAAAQLGDTALLTELLKDPDIRKTINEIDIKGRTALIFAVINGHNNAVKMLLQVEGINLEFQDSEQYTAIMRAIINNHFEIVKLLHANKAKLDKVDHLGLNCLAISAFANNPEMTQYLLKNISQIGKDTRAILEQALTTAKGIKLSYLKSTYREDLSEAQNKENNARIQKLIQAKLDELKKHKKEADSKKSQEKGKPQDEPILKITNRDSIFQDLAQGGQLQPYAFNAQTGEIITSLSAAAHNGEMELLKELIKDSEIIKTINEADKEGTTALMFAIIQGKLAAVQMLLNVPGLNLDQQDNDDNSAVMHAIANNRFGILKLLHEKKARLDLPDKLGQNCLTVSVYANNPDITQYLLDHIKEIGKNPLLGLIQAITVAKRITTSNLKSVRDDLDDQQNKLNNVLIQQLLSAKFEEIVNTGKEDGKKDSKTSADAKASDFAKASTDRMADRQKETGKPQAGNKHAKAVLIELYEETSLENSKLIVFMKKTMSGVQKLIIKNNTTPLIIAAHGGRTEQVKQLLSDKTHQKQINKKDATGKTALMYAAINGHIEIVKELLKVKKYIQINEKDLNGETALLHAIANNKFDIVQILCDAGADINTKNVVGDTALLFAVAANNPEMMAYLLERATNLHSKGLDGDIFRKAENIRILTLKLVRDDLSDKQNKANNEAIKKLLKTKLEAEKAKKESSTSPAPKKEKASAVAKASDFAKASTDRMADRKKEQTDSKNRPLNKRDKKRLARTKKKKTPSPSLSVSTEEPQVEQNKPKEGSEVNVPSPTHETQRAQETCKSSQNNGQATAAASQPTLDNGISTEPVPQDASEQDRQSSSPSSDETRVSPTLLSQAILLAETKKAQERTEKVNRIKAKMAEISRIIKAGKDPKTGQKLNGKEIEKYAFQKAKYQTILEQIDTAIRKNPEEIREERMAKKREQNEQVMVEQLKKDIRDLKLLQKQCYREWQAAKAESDSAQGEPDVLITNKKESLRHTYSSLSQKIKDKESTLLSKKK
jgi:ankyrin repeat protein